MNDRIRMTAMVLAACVAFGAPGAMAARPGRAQASADADRARLTAMCGTWDVEMTIWPRPGGAGLTTKATSTIRPLFEGLFIEEKIEGAIGGAPFGTLAWTGVNPATKQYEATRISSTNPARIVETGVYDETAKHLELEGDYRLGADTWHQRTVIVQSSADAMIATSYLSFGTVPEWKGVEIKYARRPASPDTTR